MNFSQFLLILRARLKIVLLTIIVAVATTLLVSSILPKSYKATSSLLMNYKGVDPVTGLTLPGQLLPGYMATQIDIISSKSVALRVVDQLHLDKNQAVIDQFNEANQGRGNVRDWLADLLLKKLEVVPSKESSVVELSYKGADPQFVAAVANAFADEYQKISIQLKVEPMKKAANYFQDQIKLLRDNVEVAQARMSKYQQEHGIVNADTRLDVETNRLNDLSAQLVGAQGARIEASSRQRMAQGASAGDSPDVAANPLIQNMKASVANAESKFAELSQRLDQNHPLYQSSKAELERLRADLQTQMRSTANSVGNNAQILSQREGEIRAALEIQRSKILELNLSRDELGVLGKDVENAQRAFDAASQRFSQTKIEGQVDQSDIAVLNPAVAPTEPAGPKILINTAVALFLGTLLGLGFGMVAELLDRRVRSSDDLVNLLNVPVLGEVSWGPTKRKTRFFNRSLQHNLKLN